LDLSEATKEEAASLGLAQKAIMSSMRQILNCRRIYTFTLAEKVPHFHMHIIPISKSFPEAFVARGIMSYPLLPGPDDSTRDQFCERMAKSLQSMF
jgi:diadenosine tetraphosphate (Ap4A) HIT family hydrolase